MAVIHRGVKRCPFCLNNVTRVRHTKRGEVTLEINGRKVIRPPQEIITFYPCGCAVENKSKGNGS